MDIRKCVVCETEFDFDTSGLQGPDSIIVCGPECAKRLAKSRGHRIMIHDNSGAVAETDVKPGDKIKKHLW